MNSNLYRAPHPVQIQVAAENPLPGRLPPERRVPPELWNYHKQEITLLWCDKKWTLEQIRVHFQRNRLFEASPKLWKNQLSEWDLGRNLNEDYAAHILKLHKDAERQGINRKVFFRGREKSLQDISAYRRKSKPRRSEDYLLQRVQDSPGLPPCITFADLSVDPSKISSGQISFSAPGSTSGSSSRPTSMKSPIVLPSTGRTSWSSLPSTSPWTVVDPPSDNDVQQFHLGETSVLLANDFDMELDEDMFAAELMPEGVEELEPRRETIAIDSSQLGPGNAASVVLPLISSRPIQAEVGCSPYFHGSMSVSPVHHWTEETIDQISWDIRPDNLSAILKDPNDYTQPNPKLHTAYFLLHCIQWCLFQNQQQFPAAVSQLDAAMADFQQVVQHQFDECLTTLSGLLAILESYGQRTAARQILLRVAQIFQNRARAAGSLVRDPFYETVMFMCQTQIPDYGTSGKYDMLILDWIRDELSQRYGERSKFALLARFNVAWAQLEQKKYQVARSQLLELRPLTEQVFGLSHLQSISCVATLARAHLHCGEYATAHGLIEECAVPRIQKKFSRSHPYYWEARYRQALFMKKWSENEYNSATQVTLRSDAEAILREVILWRLTVLGPKNPRTDYTFRALKALLEDQKKFDEAENLDVWCTRARQQERERLLSDQVVPREY